MLKFQSSLATEFFLQPQPATEGEFQKPFTSACCTRGYLHSAACWGETLGDRLIQTHVHSTGVSLADNVDVSKAATEVKGDALFTGPFPL